MEAVMAQVIEPAIDPNQVVSPDDADFISPDDKAALEAEKRGETPEEKPPPPVEPEPKPEPQKEPEPKPEPVETRQDDRPELNRRIEQNRKERAERTRETRDRQLLEEQLRALREENLRYKTRAELEEEARKRLDDLKKQSERPDPDTDPYGYRLWSQEQQVAELSRWKENREQQELAVKRQHDAAEAQQRQYQEAIKYLEDDARDFMVDHPDYADAAAHVRMPLEVLYRGLGANDQQLNQIVFAYNMSAAMSAMPNGRSVAEQVYNAALKSGYRPRAAAPVQNGNGATAPQQPQQTAAQKIERAQKAQSLQGLGGKTPAQRDESEDLAQMNEEALSELSDDEFLRLKQDPRLARVLNKKVQDLF
jgi:hypothetical protein